MFSNLASYIFGGSNDEEAIKNNEEAFDKAQAKVNSTSASEAEEWVVVGGEVQPALTLGSLNDVAARPTTGSTGSSEAPSEMEEDEDMVVVGPPDAPNLQESGASSREITLTRSARRLTSPLACANGISLTQMKALRSAQKLKQKDSSKHATTKATERQNKAVKIRSNHAKSRQSKSANLAMKSAGFNKHLKQC